MSSELADARGYVHQHLTVLLPEEWDIKPGLRPVGKITSPTVYLNYQSIEPITEAGPGNVRCGFEVAVVDPLEDQAKAEDAIDVEVVKLLVALDRHPTISFSRAEKKSIDSTPYLGWVFTVTVIATATSEE